MSKVYEKNKNNIVYISSEYEHNNERKFVLSTGFFISEKYVMAQLSFVSTINGNNIVEFNNIYGEVGNNVIKLKIYKYDIDSDIAILKANEYKNKSFVIWSDNFKINDKCFAITRNRHIKNYLTNGIIISKLIVSNIKTGDYINGSPLFNCSGNVIGIINNTIQFTELIKITSYSDIPFLNLNIIEK